MFLIFYLRGMFPDGKKAIREINKSRSMSDYRAAVSTLFSVGGFDGTAKFQG